jgi:hypothetical protein
MISLDQLLTHATRLAEGLKIKATLRAKLQTVTQDIPLLPDKEQMIEQRQGR